MSVFKGGTRLNLKALKSQQEARCQAALCSSTWNTHVSMCQLFWISVIYVSRVHCIYFLRDVARLFYLWCPQTWIRAAQRRTAAQLLHCSPVVLELPFYFVYLFIYLITILPNYWCSYLFLKTFSAESVNQMNRCAQEGVLVLITSFSEDSDICLISTNSDVSQHLSQKFITKVPPACVCVGCEIGMWISLRFGLRSGR